MKQVEAKAYGYEGNQYRYWVSEPGGERFGVLRDSSADPDRRYSLR
ncbi:hypothetical protein ACWD5Q_12475 [Streptomyces sp. NPDC002513]